MVKLILPCTGKCTVGRPTARWTDNIVKAAESRWMQFIMEILGGGLCSAVDFLWLMMILKNTTVNKLLYTFHLYIIGSIAILLFWQTANGNISWLIYVTRQGVRKFSQDVEKPIPVSKKSVTPLPPLSEPMPSLPPVVYSTAKSEDCITEVTTLSNGLKVASEKKFGQFCTAGVVIDSGPRYEVAYPNGICHFLEKLSFGATHKYATRDVMLRELERHGGICDCQGSRDTTVYATSADSRGLEAVTQVLAEVTLRPQLSAEEIEAARQAVAYELETLSMRPEQETILMDMIHSAAYRGNTLGLPKICPKENVNKIDRGIILNYLKNHYTPDRMVVAAVGVDHEPFVEYVQKYFVDMKPTWQSEDNETFTPKVDKSISQYTGGIEQEECEIPLYPGSDLPELSHIVIGLESCSHSDPDFVATCVLNMMMGGGGSFSAGGPGKGMYTRLYTNVLNRYHWMFNATAYNHAYGDTGLFCVHSASPPNRIYDTTLVIARELANMAGKVGEMELRRAKTQLQSMLLMNLEARPVVFEDVGRQVLATGKRKPPSFFINEIEKISADDIVRVARRMLNGKPSVAARGRLAHLPTFEEIQSNMSLTKSDASPQGRRLNLFRA